MTYQPGDRVTWYRIGRDGHGFGADVPAVVVKVGPRRITIDADLPTGRTARIAVEPENLSPVWVTP